MFSGLRSFNFLTAKLYRSKMISPNIVRIHNTFYHLVLLFYFFYAFVYYYRCRISNPGTYDIKVKILLVQPLHVHTGKVVSLVTMITSNILSYHIQSWSLCCFVLRPYYTSHLSISTFIIHPCFQERAIGMTLRLNFIHHSLKAFHSPSSHFGYGDMWEGRRSSKRNKVPLTI